MKYLIKVHFTFEKNSTEEKEQWASILFNIREMTNGNFQALNHTKDYSLYEVECDDEEFTAFNLRYSFAHIEVCNDQLDEKLRVSSRFS